MYFLSLDWRSYGLLIFKKYLYLHTVFCFRTVLGDRHSLEFDADPDPDRELFLMLTQVHIRILP